MVWCRTPLPTATFPHGLVQSRRRIRSRGRRWRVASYQRKVVEMDPFRPPPEGPPQAGGDPAPGNVATTRLPGAGVREHPAPLGALRPDMHAHSDIIVGQGAPRTARCIKTRGFEPRRGALTTRQGPPRAFASPAHHLTGGPRWPVRRARTGQDLALWRLPRTGGHFVQSGTFCAQSDLDWLLCAQSVTLCTKCSSVHRMFPYTQFSVVLRMLVPSSVGAGVNESARSR